MNLFQDLMFLLNQWGSILGFAYTLEVHCQGILWCSPILPDPGLPAWPLDSRCQVIVISDLVCYICCCLVLMNWGNPQIFGFWILKYARDSLTICNSMRQVLFLNFVYSVYLKMWEFSWFQNVWHLIDGSGCLIVYWREESVVLDMDFLQ